MALTQAVVGRVIHDLKQCLVSPANTSRWGALVWLTAPNATFRMSPFIGYHKSSRFLRQGVDTRL